MSLLMGVLLSIFEQGASRLNLGFVRGPAETVEALGLKSCERLETDRFFCVA